MPPVAANKAEKWVTFDGNATIKLGGDETIVSGRLPNQIVGPAAMGVNFTANDTIAHVVANLEKNEQSETGGDDYQNPQWLDDKRAANMDIGGPGGTGSSFHGKSTSKPMSYMEAGGPDMNISVERRKR